MYRKKAIMEDQVSIETRFDWVAVHKTTAKPLKYLAWK